MRSALSAAARGSARLGTALGVLFFVSACSSSGDKPKPADLVPVNNLLAIKQAWSVPLAGGHPNFELTAVGDEVLAAGREGVVLRINAATGEVLSRVAIERGVQAGVGGDAARTVVVNQQNEVVVSDKSGALLWKARLPSQVAAAPLVTRDVVVVLSADQVITAFASQSGTKLWATSKPVSGLTLNRAGGLVQVGAALFAGLPGGKLVSYSLAGAQRFEVNALAARGANELERLTDLIGRPAVDGSDLCVRSFQAGVSCLSSTTGRSIWQRKANGYTAVAADSEHVYLTEANGDLLAYGRTAGDTKWAIERFRHRVLSAPQAVGRNVAFGDSDGNLHLVDRKDGSNVARMSTDGSPITTQPVLVGQTLVVRTQNAVFGFSAQ